MYVFANSSALTSFVGKKLMNTEIKVYIYFSTVQNKDIVSIMM